MSRKRSTPHVADERDKDKAKRRNKFSSSVTCPPKEKRFHFKNFNDRIEDIDISSIQNIGGYRGPGPSTSDCTWFELSLKEWKELNCSAAFAKFCYAVTPMTGTLARLLFNRDRITEEIFEVLRKANEAGPDNPIRLALAPVLSLTAMFAKDLGSEFYCHFPEFFRLILPILISTADPEIIEAAFSSLLYVFKCLLDELLNNLPSAFETFVKPIISVSDQLHLRRFGSQCFGYLIRKSQKISESGFFEIIEAQADNVYTEFIADAFVAAILDDSTGRFRTCLKGLVLEIVEHLKSSNCENIWCDILRILIVKLLDETDLDHNGPIWKILLQLIDEPISYGFFAEVLVDAFAYRRGTRVQFHSALLPGLMKYKSIELIVHFMRSMDLETTLQNRLLTVKLVEGVLENDCKRLLSFCKGLVAVGWLQYDLILSDLVRTYISRSTDSAIIIEILEVLLSKYPSASDSLSSIPLIFETLRLEILGNKSSLSLRALKLLINCFPASKFPHDIIPYLIAKFEFIFKSGSFERQELILFTQIISSKNLIVTLSIEEILKFICDHPLKYPEELEAVRVALRLSSNINSNSEALFSLLLLCLRSHSSEWRRYSLELMALIYQSNSNVSEVINTLLKIENIPSNLDNYREKLMQLRKLEHLKPIISEFDKLSVSLILNYLIGFIQVRLSLLWTEGYRILSKFATEHDYVFSSILSEIFENINSETAAENIMVASTSNLDGMGMGCDYDFEIDDVGLKNLKRIRAIINGDKFSEVYTSDTADIILLDRPLLVSSVCKLFTAYPEPCLARGTFCETVFIPLVISTFSNADNENKLIRSNLESILRALSGIKLEYPETTNFKIENLENMLLKFLSHGDMQLQNLALDALFNTKKFGLALSNIWKSRLKSLLNDNLFREELTNLTAEAESLPKIVHWYTLLAPIIVRIFFGRFIARKGAAAGRHSLPLRRKIIMDCFGTWDKKSLTLIVDFLLNLSKDGPRHQLGFLNVLGEVFQSLGHKLEDESMNRLIRALIDLYSQIKIKYSETEFLDDEEMKDHQIDSNDDNTDRIEYSSEYSKDNHRRMRQLIMKRLLQLFKLFELSALKRLAPFLSELFSSILNPRINQLSTHFTNSLTSSSLLDILVCIASNCDAVDLKDILTFWSPQLWEKSVEAFGNSSAKPIVISQLLTFFEEIILKSMKKSEVIAALLISHMSPLLDAFDTRLYDLSHLHITSRIVALCQVICPHVSSPEQASRLCKTFETLLRAKSINESIRTNLITALSDLIYKSSLFAPMSKSLFDIVSAQWNILKGRPGRESLCVLFDRIAQLSPECVELTELANLLRDLNSWLPGRLNEPNFDLRLTAFARLRKNIDSGELSSSGSLDVYVPIVWSMIYFLQDIDELSIRNQSFGVLKALVKKLSEVFIPSIQEGSLSVIESDSEDVDSELKLSLHDNIQNKSATPLLIQRIILPAIKKGFKSRIEIVRIEFVALLDILISAFPTRLPFNSLHALTHPVDEQILETDLAEENIFRNIYHIQEPRRNRAIRQIGELAASGKLIGITRGIIEDLLSPLVIFTALPDPRGENDFVVSEAMQNDSISTYGTLLAQLPWKVFLRKLTQFVKEISENTRSELWNRAVMRLLPVMISQFKMSNEIKEFSEKVNSEILPAMFRLLHKTESSGASASVKTKKIAKTASGAPLASSETISVKNSLRVPIAISIGQLIKLISRGKLDSSVVLSHLPRLLTDLLNVLKQKDAETRDVARGAVVKIMGIFGTAYFPFLLKEARSLLNRGYQRHVLTFTAHAVLVEFLRRQRVDICQTNNNLIFNLDASADLLVDLALSSSFGFQASERATIEWSGKQPEVRAAKGPEIIALTAQFTSQNVLEKSLIHKITQISLLDFEETSGFLNIRGTGALDEKAEAIERIEGETFESLLRALFSNGIYPLIVREPERLPACLAAMHQILSYPCDSGSRSHLHRLQSRAFEFISNTLNGFKAEDFILLSQIVPFISLTRDYILGKGKHVIALTSAITLFNQFIAFKSLHPSIIDLQPLLYNLFSIILKGNSGNTEGSLQLSAAYKLISTLIRDWPDLEVTDTQVKVLIEYTRLQLENPHQQSLTFALIKSLISRQIVFLQLFELMETIRMVMLTSHQASTRQQCRSTYVHFLTNYPMATKKLDEQLDFLLANIRYEFATGRESCIEVMNTLLLKLGVEIIEGIADAWFVGFAVQLSKENSPDGSIEVAELILRTIPTLFNRLNPGKRRQNLEVLLLRWILQSPKLSVQRAAWKIISSILKEISEETRNQILEKAVDLMSNASTPEELLRIVIDVVRESVDNGLCPETILNSVAQEAAEQKFFKESCELNTRHSIARLWNSILSKYK